MVPSATLLAITIEKLAAVHVTLIDMNQSDHQDALADQDECQQKKLPASASMTIESSPSTVDGRKSAVAALATPAERLERELYRSRKFLKKCI